MALFDAERVNIETGQAWASRNFAARSDAARLAFAFTNAGAYRLELRLVTRQRIGWLETAVDSGRRVSDRRGERTALRNLGNTWAALGEPRKAVGLYEQHLAIAREIGDRRGEGAALFNAAVVYETLGERERALASAHAALDLLRAVESPHVPMVEAWLRERGAEV